VNGDPLRQSTRWSISDERAEFTQFAKASILPGDITYQDVREGQQGFKPVYQVDPRINELEQKQAQVRQRIQRAFYEDLFLMLANDYRNDRPTAREIDERHEEKLLALGPVA